MRLRMSAMPYEAEEDGSLTILVSDEDRKVHDVSVPMQFVWELIREFQQAQLRRLATNGSAYPPMAETTVLAAVLGQHDGAGECLLNTTETGWLVLHASDEMIREMQDAMSAVLAYRTSRRKLTS